MEPQDQEKADLVAYLDGELDEPTARAVEAKLHQDPGARAEAEALKRTWDLLDYLPRPSAPTDFASRTLDRITAQQPRARWLSGTARRRPWAAGLGWAAAVLAALALGYGGGAYLARRTGAGGPAGIDPRLVQDLPVIENLRLYQHVDDIDFLRQLADPDLFGEDNQNS